MKSRHDLPDASTVPGESRVPAHISGLVVAFAAMALFLLLLGWLVFLPMVRDGGVDFRNMYAAGYMVRTGHGHEIYDFAAQKRYQDALVSPAPVSLPFIRPAYQALLFVPFSWLPFREAYLAFLAFSLALLALCYMLMRPQMLHLALVWRLLPAGLFLFVPIAVALMQGQDSILLLTLFAGALLCMRHGRECLAGALLALGLFKFQLVIPIALLFLAWRRWRFSAAFACVAALLAAISAWIAGPGEAAQYLRSVIQVGASHGFDSGPALRMEVMANLHGAVYGLLGPSTLALPLTAVASAAAMIFAALRRPLGMNALAAAIPVATLVSYYLFIHDMCILLIPIAMVLDSLAGAEAKMDRQRRMKLAAAVLMFAAPACMFLAIHQFWIVCFPMLAFAVAVFARPATAVH